MTRVSIDLDRLAEAQKAAERRQAAAGTAERLAEIIVAAGLEVTHADPEDGTPISRGTR